MTRAAHCAATRLASWPVWSVHHSRTFDVLTHSLTHTVSFNNLTDAHQIFTVAALCRIYRTLLLTADADVPMGVRCRVVPDTH
jgi:hypothetical protein